MKAVMQAAWLMTVAAGSLVVIVVAEASVMAAAAEFVFFAGLMGVVLVVFVALAVFYYECVYYRLHAVCVARACVTGFRFAWFVAV